MGREFPVSFVSMDLNSTIDLRHGGPMPRLGLGVFRAGQGGGTQDAVIWALERGYRHVDTAHIYGNETDVGVALRASGVPREEVFITTKLWNADHGYEEALAACDASLEALGLDYVDLYLVHWPVTDLRLQSWRALEKALADGKTKAIGVSNYMPRHLEELKANSDVLPAVNQIELHPFCQQRDAVDWCREHDVVVQAYCPVIRGKRFDDRTIAGVVKETGKTPAQVLIRWSLQKGFVPLPKSSNQRRIDENASVFDFELTDAQMARLDELEQGMHIAWDPTDEP